MLIIHINFLPLTLSAGLFFGIAQFEAATFKGVPKRKHAYEDPAWLGDQPALSSGYGDQSGLLDGYDDQSGALNGYDSQWPLVSGLSNQLDGVLNGLSDSSNSFLGGLGDISSALLKRKGLPSRAKPKKSGHKSSSSGNKSPSSSKMKSRLHEQDMTLKILEEMETTLKSISQKRVGKWQ